MVQEYPFGLSRFGLEAYLSKKLSNLQGLYEFIDVLVHSANVLGLALDIQPRHQRQGVALISHEPLVVYDMDRVVPLKVVSKTPYKEPSIIITGSGGYCR